MRLHAVLAAAVLLAACHRHDHETTTDKDHLEPAVITHFTAASELFVEFDPLRAGETSTFAAHLTRLADFKPVTEGRVVVTLSGGGQPEERFEVDAPASPGIFKPEVKPKAAGTRRLVLALEAPNLRDAHDLGEVTVFADTQAALEAESNEKSEDAGAIRFLKEQQWQVDFAVAPAEQRALRATVPATGIVRGSADGSAQVAAPVSGQLLAGGKGFPRVGMTLAQGDPLFRIVPRLAPDTDVATLRLGADRARLRVEHTQRELSRLEQLHKEEAVPERRVREARNEADIARAELDAAQQRLAPLAGGDRGAAGVLVRTPVSGSVVEMALAAGAFVNEGQVLAQVADTSRLWLEARVAEADAARLGEVKGAWIRASGMAEPMALEVGRNARLVVFGRALDRETRTVPLILEFRDPGKGLRIGAAVRVELWSGARSETLAVPASALVDEGGQTVLFVQRDGESFERRVVTPGLRDGNQVEVRTGLKPGERVVTRGAYLVRLAGASPKAAGEGHTH